MLQGWFTKQPERRGKCKRRFFTLTFTAEGTAEIQYFGKATAAAIHDPTVSVDANGKKMMTGVNSKGSFTITPECVVECGAGPGREFLLTITTNDRVWRLEADE